MKYSVLKLAALSIGLASTLSAQEATQPRSTPTQSADHAAQHGAAHHGGEANVKRPKVFLNKSPKIVEYQLKRLTNSELLLVERSDDNPLAIPVYAAILVRPGLPSSERQAAAAALANLKSTTVTQELLLALDSQANSSPDNAESARSARELASILLTQPRQELVRHTDKLLESLSADWPWTRRAAAAALLLADQAEALRAHAAKSADSAIDFLTSISWLSDPALRDSFRQDILPWLAPSQPEAVRRQAIRTLATTKVDTADSFAQLVKLYEEAPLRNEAVKALLLIPAAGRDPRLASQVAQRLVEEAEATAIADRTSDSFVDAAQLAESLFPLLPAELSRGYRERLRAVAVRVVRIRTVEEEMRYDVKYFAVEAGRPVEILLTNEDLMPHNLVITAPGALKEVAFAAAQMAPDQTTDGKQYVPASSQVLFATAMVPANKQERLSFSAPETPGEYPFVCTFPNHWMRMYGVMVVVSDLDAWQKQPTVPADPIGNNRSFVRKWNVADLADQLPTGLRGRSEEIGARLFKEASCAQCHKLRGSGGFVGPDLTESATRWKGDTRAILQEILDPSHKIDSKYAVQSVLTADGKVYSGIVVSEDKDALSMVLSPEQTEPLKIARDDVEEIVKSSKSIMPVGLLDQYTQDEIFEILSYIVESKP